MWPKTEHMLSDGNQPHIFIINSRQTGDWGPNIVAYCEEFGHCPVCGDLDPKGCECDLPTYDENLHQVSFAGPDSAFILWEHPTLLPLPKGAKGYADYKGSFGHCLANEDSHPTLEVFCEMVEKMLADK